MVSYSFTFCLSVNEFAYWDWTLASGLAAFTPAINPYLKVSITYGLEENAVGVPDTTKNLVSQEILDLVEETITKKRIKK